MPPNIQEQFFKIKPGDKVVHAQKTYTVSHILSVDSALVQDLETNDYIRVPMESLSLPRDAEDTAGKEELLEYSEAAWLEGQRRFQAIKSLLENPFRSSAEIQAVMTQYGVSRATLYRWLHDYTEAGHVSALVPGTPGRKTGTVVLDAEREAIIRGVIDEVYLSKQNGTPEDVVEAVNRACRMAKIRPPHPNTVRNRVRRVSKKVSLRRRGRKQEADRFDPVRGSFPGATYPYSVVQIDHTPMDIVTVDEIYRQPVGRPYLTLAIDVFSRMIAGIYMSYDHPNAAAVGLCIAQAVCPKREYLAALGIAGDWPVWGRMDKVHIDNAKEFRSAAVDRGCEEYRIGIEWRPVKTPRYGGHIERLIGTTMRQVHKLPGTTFSNVKHRGEYDSDKESALTLRELEQHVVDFIVNVYHQRVHSELLMSPLRKWTIGVTGTDGASGTGIMGVPHDPARLVIDFLPASKRTVQQYGIRIGKITYYDPVLDPYIEASDPENPKAKRKFIIRQDPRDIKQVYFFDPVAKRYTTIPYRNLANPAMSQWEYSRVMKILRDEGRRDVDEELIFRTLERMRGRVADAVQKTKAARRHVQRNPAYRQSVQSGQTTAPALAARHAPSVPFYVETIEEDPFAEPVTPFEDRSLRR